MYGIYCSKYYTAIDYRAGITDAAVSDLINPMQGGWGTITKDGKTAKAALIWYQI